MTGAEIIIVFGGGFVLAVGAWHEWVEPWWATRRWRIDERPGFEVIRGKKHDAT